MKKVYGYARISRDEDKKNYGSIETQKNLIKEFAKQNGWEIEKIYVDDDISGYISIENRPAFNELYKIVNNLKQKPIVLMKDWSRLSRNNGIAQTILTNWKQEEVELILIKEMGGTFNILKDNDDIVGITTWINERYIKETSRKVRDALMDRMKQGVYISGPRYGYIKEKNGTLIINEEVKEAVQIIFDLYEQGLGITTIAKKLNAEYDYKNPSVIEAERFKKERGRNIKRNVREYWEADMINKILKDELYIGTLITRKKEVKGIHGKVKVLPKEENYRFENHHEAIINKEQFDRVQKLLKKRRNETGQYKKGKYYYVFGGIIKCGECGSSATGFTEKGEQYYQCLKYSKYGKSRCVYNIVKEEYILENIKILLKDVKIKYKKLLEEMNIEITKIKSDEEILKNKLKKIKQEYKIMQSQKVKEIAIAKTSNEEEIIEEMYRDLIKNKIIEIEEITKVLNKMESQKKQDKAKNAVNYFDDIIKSNKPPKRVMEELVEKIIIYKNKNIEIKLKADIENLICCENVNEEFGNRLD